MSKFLVGVAEHLRFLVVCRGACRMGAFSVQMSRDLMGMGFPETAP
jgi:hypothetical protein